MALYCVLTFYNEEERLGGSVVLCVKNFDIWIYHPNWIFVFVIVAGES